MSLGNPALHLKLSMLCVALFAEYLSVSSPSSLLVDLGTDVVLETNAAPEIDDTTNDPAFAAEQPGKHPPLSIPISPILFSLVLALELLLLLLYLF
jgi:hypothetical protein